MNLTFITTKYYFEKLFLHRIKTEGMDRTLEIIEDDIRGFETKIEPFYSNEFFQNKYSLQKDVLGRIQIFGYTETIKFIKTEIENLEKEYPVMKIFIEKMIK